MAEEIEIRCPYCGKSYSESTVVGKIRTFHKGVRSTYEVALCVCGKTFRGNILEEKKLK
jgi:hypothetical protein